MSNTAKTPFEIAKGLKDKRVQEQVARNETVESDRRQEQRFLHDCWSEVHEFLMPFAKDGWEVSPFQREWRFIIDKWDTVIEIFIEKDCVATVNDDCEIVERRGLVIGWELLSGYPRTSDLYGEAWVDDHRADPNHPDGFIVKFGTWMANYL